MVVLTFDAPQGWNLAPPWTVYFCGSFDAAPSSYATFLGTGNTNATLAAYPAGDSVTSSARLGVLYTFDTANLTSRVGVSFISAEQACQNVDSQIRAGTALETVVQGTRDAWNDQILSKVTTTDTNVTNLELLYTSLYHMNIIPTNKTGENPLWESSEPYYDDIFTLWDLVRPLLPLKLSSNHPPPQPGRCHTHLSKLKPNPPVPLRHRPLPHHPPRRLRGIHPLANRRLAPRRLPPRRALLLLERRDPRRLQRRQRPGRRLRQEPPGPHRLGRRPRSGPHRRRHRPGQQRRPARHVLVHGAGPRRPARLARAGVDHAAVRAVRQPRRRVRRQRLCRVADRARRGARRRRRVPGAQPELAEPLGPGRDVAGVQGVFDAAHCRRGVCRAGSAELWGVLLD